MSWLPCLAGGCSPAGRRIAPQMLTWGTFTCWQPRSPPRSWGPLHSKRDFTSRWVWVLLFSPSILAGDLRESQVGRDWLAGFGWEFWGIPTARGCSFTHSSLISISSVFSGWEISVGKAQSQGHKWAPEFQITEHLSPGYLPREELLCVRGGRCVQPACSLWVLMALQWALGGCTMALQVPCARGVWIWVCFRQGNLCVQVLNAALRTCWKRNWGCSLQTDSSVPASKLNLVSVGC